MKGGGLYLQHIIYVFDGKNNNNVDEENDNNTALFKQIGGEKRTRNDNNIITIIRFNRPPRLEDCDQKHTRVASAAEPVW